MKNNKELVAFATSKLGTCYVYGMKGKVMTLDMYKQLKKAYPSIVRDSDANKVGKVCVDCSGLISWYTGNIKSSSMFKSEATYVYPINTISNAPVGAAVWRKGHIGIYVGNGYAIEARGSAYGVVKTKVTDRDWTHWFLLKDISYAAVEESSTEHSQVSYFKKYTGKSVSIVDALSTIGAESSFSYRKKIAEANKIVEYTGTAAQNANLLAKLKNGILVKP